jgi:hypothetical protein
VASFLAFVYPLYPLQLFEYQRNLVDQLDLLSHTELFLLVMVEKRCFKKGRTL